MRILLLLGLLLGGQDTGPTTPDATPQIRDAELSSAVAALQEVDERTSSVRTDIESLKVFVQDLGAAVEAFEQDLPRKPLGLKEMEFDDLERVGPEIEASRVYLSAWRARDASRTRAEELAAAGGEIAERLADDLEASFARAATLRPQLLDLERRVARGEVREADLGLSEGRVAEVLQESSEWLQSRDSNEARAGELLQALAERRVLVSELPPIDPEDERAIARIELALSTISEALAAQSELVARLREAPAETLLAEAERTWQEWEARRDSVISSAGKFEEAHEDYATLLEQREGNEVPSVGEVPDGDELYEVRRARRDVEYSKRLIAYFETDQQLAAALRDARDVLVAAESDVARRHAAFSRQTARVMSAIREISARSEEAEIEIPEAVDARVAWDSWRDLQSAEADRREFLAAARAEPLDGPDEERVEAERETLRLAEVRLESELSHAEFVASMEDRSDQDLADLLAEGAGIEQELADLDARLEDLDLRLSMAGEDCVAIAEELREIKSPYERGIVQRQPDRAAELKELVLALEDGEVLLDAQTSLEAERSDSIGKQSREMIDEFPDMEPLATALWEQDRVTRQQEHMRLMLSYCKRLAAAHERLVDAGERRRALGVEREQLIELRIRQLKMRYAAANELSGRIARGEAAAERAPRRLAEWVSSADVAAAGEELRDWRKANVEFLARVSYLTSRLESILVLNPVMETLTASADERANVIGTPVSRMASALTPVDELDTVPTKMLQFEADVREAEETPVLEAMMKRFTSGAVVERFENPLGAYYLELANADRVLAELSEAESAYGLLASTWHEDRDRLLPARELAARVKVQREFDYHAARYAASVARFPDKRKRIEESFRTVFDADLPYRVEVDLGDIDECVDALFGAETRYTAHSALQRDLERLLSQPGIELEVAWYREQVSRVRAMLERAKSDQVDLRRRIDELRSQYRARLNRDAIIGVAVTLLIPLIAWLVVLLVRRIAKRFEYDVVGELGEHASDRKRRLRTLARTVAAALTVLIWALAAIYIFAQLGLDVTPLIASASVVGLAVAFGAQALIKDFFYGFFILLENQFTVGDVVRLGTISGTVERISLRITILRDLKGVVHYIPNGSIGQVSNMTQEWARVVLEISVPYREDPDRATAVLKDALHEFYADPDWNYKILEEPVVAGVENLTERSIDIRLMIKVRPGRQWEVAREARRRIKQRLDREGIASPFPHRVIHQIGGNGDGTEDASRD